MTAPRIVVGASHAGSELAAKLRQLDPATPVVLIGEEPVLPYQRPPLSKTWLAHPSAEVDVLLIRAAQAYAAAGIETMTGARVACIDRARRRLHLDSGRVLDYGQLALATGARPRRLDPDGTGRADRAANVHHLRTLGDAQRLRPQFVPGARVVIVGGGYIGLEIAALAIKTGLQVTVLEAQPRVLARVTAPQMSAFYEGVHRHAGVDVRTGARLEGFEHDADGRVRAVLCSDGSGRHATLEADLVVAGIGVVPDVELARAAGLDLASDGVRVDELCRTSDPAIVAAGDCTSRPVAGHAGTIRIESVPNAVEQARTAAATLCGLRQPCGSVPWFWSDQYDLKLQMVGLSHQHDEVVIRGDMSTRSFTAWYLKGDALIAADAVNRPAEFMLARKLVAANACVDPACLADPACDLKRWVAA